MHVLVSQILIKNEFNTMFHICKKLLCSHFVGWTFLQITIVDENAAIEAFAFYLTPEHAEIMNKYENKKII